MTRGLVLHEGSLTQIEAVRTPVADRERTGEAEVENVAIVG